MRQGVNLHESDFSENYYDILQVSPKASDIVIKAAYRSLAQKYHPDKYDGSTDDADFMMKKINLAYQTLSDFNTRQAYDIKLNGSLKKEKSSSFYTYQSTTSSNSRHSAANRTHFNNHHTNSNTNNSHNKNNSRNWYYQSQKKSPKQPEPYFAYKKGFWHTPWGNFFRLILWASVLGLFVHFII